MPQISNEEELLNSHQATLFYFIIIIYNFMYKVSKDLLDYTVIKVVFAIAILLILPIYVYMPIQNTSIVGSFS